MTSQTPRPRGEAGPVPPADDEISLWEVLAVLLRRRGTIVLTAVLAVAAAVAYTLLREPTFTTQTSFRPHGAEASSSQLLALASQFGVSVPGSGEEASPAFYAELLTSREILARIASKSFELEGGAPTPLAQLLEIDEPDPSLRLRDTIEKLRESVLSVQTARETGVVTLEVTTKWPELSRDIAERLLDEITRFNLDTRQSQAAAERAFIEERVDSARNALLEAEAAMQAFLQANRRIDDSPELIFQRDRLERDISLRQEVYTRLVQAFEEARIAEVRDTPVITLLQPPFLPPPDDRRLLLMAALATVLGGMAGVVLAFVVEAVQRPVDDPAREDFRRTWEGLVRSLRLGRRRAA